MGRGFRRGDGSGVGSVIPAEQEYFLHEILRALAMPATAFGIASAWPRWKNLSLSNVLHYFKKLFIVTGYIIKRKAETPEEAKIC